MSARGTATVGSVESVIPVLTPATSPAGASMPSHRSGCAPCVSRTRAKRRSPACIALLLRAARFEVARRRPTLPHLRGNELDDIANEAADDALMSVLRRLDDFRGASRFTTWVYKFALLEDRPSYESAHGKGREVPLEPEVWGMFTSSGPEPDAEAEQSELLATLQTAIADVLTPHQRSVLVALALNGVPIDVLADRLNTNRGALYKTLHDARRKLRKHLDERGLALDDWLEDR